MIHRSVYDSVYDVRGIYKSSLVLYILNKAFGNKSIEKIKG